MREKEDTATRPGVVALVGSPRRQGNTSTRCSWSWTNSSAAA